MGHRLDRRQLLAWVGASTALSACDRVNVDVQVRMGAADADGMLPITPVDYFYVYQQGRQPEDYDPDNWSMELRMDGEVIATLDNSFFETHAPIEIEHTLQCIGGNPRNTLINNAVWGGLPFDEVLAELGIDIPAATVELIMQGYDRAGPSGQYSTSIPVADLTEGRVWLVWEMAGEPLNFDHGAPCRFLVQGRYGTKNVKWPQFIDLTSTPYLGYWESLNWSNDATYQVNGFILNPSEGTRVLPGVLIYGTAHAGLDPIASVEISFDGGDSWTDTEIYYSPGPNRWTLWRYPYDGPSGAVEARIRVTTESGAMTAGTQPTNQADGYDGGMEVLFEVGR